MDVVRTPDDRFADLPGYPFAPHYVEVADREPARRRCGSTTSTRARRRAAPVLLMHGEPSWSYLYRNMIPVLVAAGHRVRRARPRRLRPLRQADRARPTTPTPATSTGCVAPVRRARPPRHHVRRPGLGRPDRPAARRRAPRPLRPRRRRRTRSCRPATARRRGVPRLAAVLAGDARSSTSAASSTAGAHRARRADVVAGVRRAVPRRHLQGRRAPVPDARADQPDDPASEPTTEPRGRCCARSTKPFLPAFSDGDPITARRRRAVPGQGARAHRASRTRRSRAAATSCRRTSRPSSRR